MECPNLDSRDPAVPLCRLKQGACYIPDDEELIQVCYTEGYVFCPVYLEDHDGWINVYREDVHPVIG